jgi:hypothetical protein
MLRYRICGVPLEVGMVMAVPTPSSISYVMPKKHAACHRLARKKRLSLPHSNAAL